MKWEHLCEAKEIGSMGFKDIEKFNDSLYAKQVWKIYISIYITKS